MADNDQNNDEYKFTDLDSHDNEMMGESESEASPSVGYQPEKKNIGRNAMIVIGLVILALLMYQFIRYFFGNKESVTPSIPPVTQVVPKTPTTITPTSIVPPQPAVNVADPEIKEKISVIEVSQQTVRSQVVTLSDQLGNVNNNINSLNTQISRLNQIIENLSNQVSQQSNEITILMARNQPKRVAPVRIHTSSKRIIYYIQAVIPGRAWLIGSNGSTLTVREGTKIAGYGLVKLIDSIQGRIITTSGQVIKFSQDDS